MTTIDAIKNPEATLIDIRNADELENDGFLEQALHIPMHEIPDRIEEIKNMSKPVVMFCKSGGRVARIIEYLETQGVEGIYNAGGLVDVKEVLEIE